MRTLLQICEKYGREFSMQFNATKSSCKFVSKRIIFVKDELHFYIDLQQIPTANEFLHLGHTIVSQLDDNKESLTKRNELCDKINNVL